MSEQEAKFNIDLKNIEEEHKKVIFNLEKKNKETVQMTEIRLETDTSVL